MKQVKLITNQDLHPDDLHTVDGKLRIKPERVNALVMAKANETQEYVLEVVTPRAIEIISDANTNTRKMVTLNGLGLGVVNLDFTCKVNGTRTVAFRMPAGAPLPAVTISTNAGSGVLWWNKGSRDIIFSEVQNNQRVLVNLVGLFK